MAAMKPVTPSDISEIQRRMAQIRHEMHQEVQGAVKGAQSLTDWQSMVKSHPWLAISIASAVGYLIVPRRRSEGQTFVTVAHPSPAPIMAPIAPELGNKTKSSKWSILGTAFSLLAPIAARVAQNYALGHLETFLAQHPLPPAPRGSGENFARGPGQSTRTGPGGRLREYG
jgi:hypothetical protein